MERRSNVTDHLANERTFLAWIRTSVGIMAFGFVVAKFSLFVKQLAYLLDKNQEIHQKGYSAFLGITLVITGLLTMVLAFLRYKKTEAQINESDYKSSSLLISILAGIILLISMFLVAYLIQNMF
jgi:putative membrane protein